MPTDPAPLEASADGQAEGTRRVGAADVAYVAALVLAWLFGVLALWAVDYLPTNDGPQHIFLGRVENLYGDQSLVYHRQWQAEGQLAAKGFSLYYAPLERALGWRSATRAVQSLFYTWSFWGFAFLVRAVRPERRWLGVLGVAVAASWPLYMGFFAYFGAQGMGLCLLAFVLSRPRFDGFVAVVTGAVLAVVFVHHAFAVVPTGLALGLVLLVREPEERRLRALGLAAAAFAPVALAAVAVVMLYRGQAGEPTEPYWGAVGHRLATIPKVLFTGLPPTRWVETALVVVGVGAAFARLRRLEPTERAALAVCVACFVLLAALPVYVPGWMLVHVRFAPFVAAFGLALLPIERLGRPAIGAALASLVAAASVGGAVRFHQRLREECAPHLGGLAAPIRRTGLRLPIVFDDFCSQPPGSAVTDVPFSGPSRHLAALYAAEQGGSIPTAFVGSPIIHPFSPRTGADALPMPTPDLATVMLAPRAAELRDPLLRRRALRRASLFGQFHEDVMVFGLTDPDVETLSKLGYEPVYRGGRVGIFELHPCTVEIAIGDDPAAEAVAVRGGLPGVDDMSWSRSALATPKGPDGVRRVPVPQRVCGAAWVEVQFRREDGVLACREAKGGRVAYAAKPGEVTVVACSAP